DDIRDRNVTGVQTCALPILSAAISCRKHELDVLVIDEFPKPGGRLLGQLHQEPSGEWWNGIKETNRLLDEANRLQTRIKCGISRSEERRVGKDVRWVWL